jgi:hypothetical protein
VQWRCTIQRPTAGWPRRPCRHRVTDSVRRPSVPGSTSPPVGPAQALHVVAHSKRLNPERNVKAELSTTRSRGISQTRTPGLPRRSGRSVLWLAGAAVPRTVAHPRDQAQLALQVPLGPPTGTPEILSASRRGGPPPSARGSAVLIPVRNEAGPSTGPSARVLARLGLGASSWSSPAS